MEQRRQYERDLDVVALETHEEVCSSDTSFSPMARHEATSYLGLGLVVLEEGIKS